MFQSARPNSRAYIWFKGNPWRFEQGYIVNQPIIRPKYSIPQSFTQPQEMMVDLTIKTDSGTYNFSSIPANLDIADTFCNGEAAVISDSRDAMSSEVLSTKQKSKDVLASREYHEDVIKNCDLVYAVLHPEYAEKQEREEEISRLKSEVSGLSDKLDTLISKLIKNE